MEIEKSQSSYALIKADLDYNLLHDIFDNFKNQLVELDLSKKFKQNNYSYSSNTNPLWKTLKIYDHWYLEKILRFWGAGMSDISAQEPLRSQFIIPRGF